MIAIVKLTSTSITSHSFVVVVLVRILKIYSPSKLANFKYTIVNYSHHAVGTLEPQNLFILKLEVCIL